MRDAIKNLIPHCAVSAIGSVFSDIGKLLGAGAPASAPTPTAPPTVQNAAPPVQSPAGSPASTYQTGPGNPSFVAAAAAPTPAQTGVKSLLGQ